jgi:hypothetical protein
MTPMSDTLTRHGRWALLIGAFFFTAVARAEARGALIYDQGACILKVGPDILYFSGYQSSSGKQKFCEDAPKAGDGTTFVFDIPEEELRQRKIGFRIVQNAGDEREPVDGALVAEVAPQFHPTGTFSLGRHFPEAGNFIGIVTIERPSGDQSTARFPFSVGGAPRSPIPYLLLGLAAALALVVFVMQRREKKG